jgi:8-oxo-dGTP pyrophosphatase MutT (NUDIX family)
MISGAAAHGMYAQKEVNSNTRVRAGVGIVIRNAEGAILLERRSDNGFWGLPGGRIEPGESILQTALREAKEETGLTITLTRLLGVYSGPEYRIVTFPDNVAQLVDILLEAVIVAGELVCSSESTELRFFHPEDFPPEVEIVPPARLPLWDIANKLIGVIR